MTSEETKKVFLETINTYLEYKIDKIITNKDWGAINFEDARSDLTRLFEMLQNFTTLPLELLPENTLLELNTSFDPIKIILDQILSFDITGNNPVGARDSLIQQLTPAVDAFYTTGHLWIPYLAYQKGDVQKHISKLTSSVEEATFVLENAKITISEKEEEINNIINAAREASASVGVAHFTSDFNKEVTVLEKSAKRWLATTIIIASLTILSASIWIIIEIPKGISTPQLIYLTISKAVILGMLFTATIWCGKLYRATKHQAATNKHRANALKTFQAFIKAASDNNVRDAVLLETTHSIFSHTATGYLDGHEASSQNNASVKVIKVAKDSIQSLTKTLE